MLIVVSKQFALLRATDLSGGHGDRVCNQLALIAPYWGFFVALSLHLQERC